MTHVDLTKATPWPVYCDRCEKWIRSGITFQPGITSRQHSFKNVGTICECGNKVLIPDGTYDIVEGAIEAVSALGLSRDELEKLSTILTRAANDLTPAGALRTIIARELPRANSLTEFLKTPAGVIALLSFIATVLAWQFPKAPPEVKKPEANRHERRRSGTLERRKVPRSNKPRTKAKKNIELDKKQGDEEV